MISNKAKIVHKLKMYKAHNAAEILVYNIRYISEVIKKTRKIYTQNRNKKCKFKLVTN